MQSRLLNWRDLTRRVISATNQSNRDRGQQSKERPEDKVCKEPDPDNMASSGNHLNDPWQRHTSLHDINSDPSKRRPKEPDTEVTMILTTAESNTAANVRMSNLFRLLRFLLPTNLPEILSLHIRTSVQRSRTCNSISLHNCLDLTLSRISDK